MEVSSISFKFGKCSFYTHRKKKLGERKMFTALSPFGKLNFKGVMLLPILLMSVFIVFPAVSQAAPAFSKISPALFEEMAHAGESINVLIKTVSFDYSSVMDQINALGGRVGQLFKYVSGLSSSLPTSKVLELTKNSMVERIYYDSPRLLASMPSVSLKGDLIEAAAIEEEAFETAAFTDGDMPSNYWNTIGMGAQDIWTETNMGADSLVVVIDTGIWLGHFMFTPKVTLGEIAGGIDLSPEASDPTFGGWNMPSNHWHGSHVAGTVASRGGIVANPGTRLYNYYANGLELYSGIPLPPGPNPGSKIIWTLGMAPAANLYVVKVFTHTGAGVPESYVIAGMEHALDLKLTQGMDVDVISMSIGGGSLFDGRDFEDMLVNTITANGITLVGAASNDGPASMTIGSPGTAYTAITAGAAEDPVHSKSYFDYRYQMVGIGDYMFTSPTPIMADYSSRGPTADGRLKPTLSATGSFVLSAYPTGGVQSVAWGSGTSMATPAISGATALINAYSEMNALGATPEDYRQALTSGAVPFPGFGQYEQGAGYLNAANALTAFKADTSYGDVAPPLPKLGWLKNIRNIPIIGKGVYTTSVSDLKPEHRAEFVFQVTEATESIQVDVTNIALGDNPLGINSLGLYIQSAKRTFADYYIYGALMVGDSSFYITDDATTYSGTFLLEPDTISQVIEPGYVKVVLMTYYQSYDAASADITITVKAKKLWPPTWPSKWIPGFIRPDQMIGWIDVPVPEGTTTAIVELWWIFDWSMYPTTDLDMIIFWNGAYDYRGATGNSPERVVLTAPTGTISLMIQAYQMYVKCDFFQIKIYFK
jgi:hypothetical protein